MGEAARKEVPGVDLERLLPWFREHVAPVDGLRAQLIGHGRCSTPPIEIGGIRPD